MNARQIDRYLKKRGSPLAGHGNEFIQAGQRFKLNPLLLVAIAGAESSFGKQMSGAHNPFGWGPGIDFSSFGAAINAVAKGLRTNYFDEGLTTVKQIQSKYAPSKAANDPTGLNNHWANNVSSILRELGTGPLGAPPGAPVSASGAPPAPVTPAGGGMPQDGSPESAIAGIAAGEQYDPLEQLAGLAATARAGAGQPSAPTGGGGGMPDIDADPGGAWGGSQGVANQFVSDLGLSMSGKRDRKNTSSGGVSDHWVGSKNAFAYDMSGSVKSMNQAAMKLSRRLGLGWSGKGPLISTIERNGYRIQVIWNTPKYGGHLNHIHFGVRRL